MRQDPEVEAFILQQRKRLTKWRTPADAIACVDSIELSIQQRFAGRLHFLHDYAALPFREMWVLGRCAAMLGRSHIRLACPTISRPDGYSRGDGCEFGAEVTEAMELGRKRRLESWEPGELRDDSVSDWVKRAEQIPVALANSLIKKKAINYPSDTELFIYLNISEYGIRQRETENEIWRQLAAPSEPFRRIYVLWKDKLFASGGRSWSDQTNSMMSELDARISLEEILDSNH